MNAPNAFQMPPPQALEAIAAIVGPKGVISGEDTKPFLTEWRDRWPGHASMIVAPSTTQEIANIVKICAAHKIAITPQGGNTGLVGGQIPFDAEILISLKRMRKIQAISPHDGSMTLEAGVTLQEAQDAARQAGYLFPLSIGSEGSCQIGGAISTNAGGVNVLRYGNMRAMVLGLEVVTPDGEIWNGLKSLRKDNTGYDLKQLFIGGEGTLGIITRAVLKIFPYPENITTALIDVASPQDAIDLLTKAQKATGGLATSFELMSRQCMDLVVKNIPGINDPMDKAHPWYVLMEFSSSGSQNLRPSVEDMLAKALEANLIINAVIADSDQQAQDLWRIRHSISEANKAEGRGVRHDVSVPTSAIPAFLKEADAAIEQIAPEARVVAFGHIGDGNIHYNLAPSPALDDTPKNNLDDKRETIENRVYDIITRLGGSISAEHGVGRHKRDAIAMRKDPIELSMMRAVKTALDPNGIMNPGKML